VEINESPYSLFISYIIITQVEYQTVTCALNMYYYFGKGPLAMTYVDNGCSNKYKKLKKNRKKL
jgi:hypothetical protein